MSKRRVYDVIPDGPQWSLKERGADRAVGRFDQKTDAVERGRDVASNQPLAQLVIHGLKGKIQTEHTYGRDPYPPKG
jgi:hypothetical protein